MFQLLVSCYTNNLVTKTYKLVFIKLFITVICIENKLKCIVSLITVKNHLKNINNEIKMVDKIGPCFV